MARGQEMFIWRNAKGGTMKSIFRTAIIGAAISAVMSLSSAAFAQGPCPLCGSQVPIKGLDKTLAEAAGAHGLVRAIAQQIGQMNNYEYVGEGTMVDLEAPTLGAAAPVSRYIFNAHQQMWASRQEIVGADKKRTIRVVKGKRGWDETWYEESTKDGPVRKLKTAPVPEAVAKLRSQLIWIQPQMFLSHAAFVAAGKCMTAEIKACDAKWSVVTENGKSVVNLEIEGRTYKGVLDGDKRVASVETMVDLPSGGGPKKIVAKYSAYRIGESADKTLANFAAMGDKSLDKFHNGVFWPSKVVFELEGKNVLDLMITEGWNNPYTIFPEPELLAQGQ